MSEQQPRNCTTAETWSAGEGRRWSFIGEKWSGGHDSVVPRSPAAGGRVHWQFQVADSLNLSHRCQSLISPSLHLTSDWIREVLVQPVSLKSAFGLRMAFHLAKTSSELHKLFLSTPSFPIFSLTNARYSQRFSLSRTGTVTYFVLHLVLVSASQRPWTEKRPEQIPEGYEADFGSYDDYKGNLGRSLSRQWCGKTSILERWKLRLSWGNSAYGPIILFSGIYSKEIGTLCYHCLVWI